MRRGISVVLAVLCATAALAQLRVVEVDPLPAGNAGPWSHPRFSPDGEQLYFTRDNFRGIWVYDREERTIREVTLDPGSGYGFSFSPDGSRLAYRRVLTDPSTRRRTQEIVLRDLSSGSASTLTRGRDLSLPAFSGERVVYAGTESAADRRNASSPDVSLVGIRETKIALVVEGRTLLLDPLQGGRYIWPSLSPEKGRILAVAMEGGAFICDLQGNLLSRLGRRNAPAWTRDGEWIIYMNDSDDGERITGSDIWYVSADGLQSGQLTFTEEVVEMYPNCSPARNEIACCTSRGEILILTYEKVTR